MSEIATGRERGSNRLRRIGLVAGCALLGAVLGVVVARVQTAEYESTARVLVGPIGGDRDTLDAAGLLTSTYADLVTSRASVARVADSLGGPLDQGQVSAVPDARARVISITVRDADPDVAIGAANLLAADLIAVVDAARPLPTDPAPAVPASPAGQVSLLDDASDAEAVGNPAVLVVLGMALLGTMVGLGVDRFVPALRTRVDGDFVESLGLPVVEVRSTEGDRHLSDDEWDLVAAQVVHECGSAGPFRSVAFLPVDAAAELASLLVHLAVAEARAGGPVTVADADPDPDRAALAGLYEQIGPGSGTVTEHEHVGRLVVPTRRGGGDPVLGGTPIRLVTPPAIGSELPARGRLQRVADALPGGSLLEVLCPAADAAPSAIAASLVVDHVVLMVRTGRSSRRAVHDALAALASVGSRPSLVLQVDRRCRVDAVALRPGPGTEADLAPSAPAHDRRQQFRVHAPSAG